MHLPQPQRCALLAVQLDRAGGNRIQTRLASVLNKGDDAPAGVLGAAVDAEDAHVSESNG